MPGARGGAGAMAWFQNVFGFEEKQYEQTREQFHFSGDVLLSKANKQEFHIGSFEMISCADLEKRLMEESAHSDEPGSSSGVGLGGLRFHNKIGDVRTLHRDRSNAGAVFQAASQFNCLEMIDYTISPLHGITMYAKDGTQGPACAMSCPGATVFRNYFVNGSGQGRKQLDGLSDVAADVDVNNEKNKYWKMVNGYCLPVTPGSVAKFSQSLVDNIPLRDRIVSKVKVGVHWDTDVHGGRHRVCQVFCSALPVAYAKDTLQKAWEPFARAVLLAAFKATLLVGAVLAKTRHARVPIYLTALGGGAFGNRSEWIATAMKDAMSSADVLAAPLDVYLVHFGGTLVRQPYDGLEKEIQKLTGQKGAKDKKSGGAATTSLATDVAEVEGPGSGGRGSAGSSSRGPGGQGQEEARQGDREEGLPLKRGEGGREDGARGSRGEGGSPEPAGKDCPTASALAPAAAHKEVASLQGKPTLRSGGKGILPSRLDDEPHHTPAEPSKNSKQSVIEERLV